MASKRTVRVSVTKQDIEAGVPRNLRCCPVAIAIRRVTGKLVSVTEYRCLYDHATAKLPKRVTRFITNFDAPAPVRPFTFTLKMR